MHEYWLQRYIKENNRQMGFTDFHGPYNIGPDFKGVYQGKRVKIEVEWDYANYIQHKHPPDFADILIVGTYKAAPERLREKLPRFIIHVDSAEVIKWAQPRVILKNEQDYYSFTWRRLARNLLYLYAFSRKKNGATGNFPGSDLFRSMGNNQIPRGFQFGEGGKEVSFKGEAEDKISWDFWLNLAHETAGHFKLKPALLRPTWIDRMGIYTNHTGRMTDTDLTRFKDIADYIDELIVQAEGRLSEDEDK